MKLIVPLLLALALVTGPAHAACFAAVKATSNNPLRLYQGVVQVSDAACGNNAQAESDAAPAVQAQGLIFGNVIATFGPSELDRWTSVAKDFFLRR